MAKPLKCDLCDDDATVHLTQIVNNQIHKIELDTAFLKSLKDFVPFKNPLPESELEKLRTAFPNWEWSGED